MADLVFWLIMAAIYAFGGVLSITLQVIETKRGEVRWPWWSYPVTFVLWWPLMAVAVVRNLTKQVKR